MPWNKGKNHSEETRKKLSEKAKKQWQDGRISPLVHEALKKGRGWNRGKKGPSGEQAAHWKGGLNNRWLKQQARIRDNDICQICGLRDPEIMEVDHIKPRYAYPELENCLENMVTLCPNCHRRKTNRETKERAKLR